MRIISGSAGGRRLFTPSDGIRTIRPTTDRAREALFSIIGTTIVNSHVVDLFAGTGAFGCEALSRGAASVLFIDSSRKALNLVEKNVNLIDGGQQRATLLQRDLSKGLVALATSGARHRFDLIFADPPYRKALSVQILHHLDNCSVLAENSMVILEESKGFSPPSGLNQLIQIDSRCYGDSLFSFFRPITNN